VQFALGIEELPDDHPLIRRGERADPAALAIGNRRIVLTRSASGKSSGML
jgi:hypothetical protein